MVLGSREGDDVAETVVVAKPVCYGDSLVGSERVECRS